MTNRQARLFDRLAAGGRLYVYAPESTAKLNALWERKGRTLDLGCGDGAITAALDGTPVIGLELSPRCAGLARRNGVRVTVGDALGGLPFASGVFDTVYCVDVLHHLHRRWETIFDELDRVTAPGGRLILVEPDARNPFVRWTQAPRSPIRVAPYEDEPAIYPDELIEPLRARGYGIHEESIHIEGDQVVRDVFPLWQRALKAPFVTALAIRYGGWPNKFAIVAEKEAG